MSELLHGYDDWKLATDDGPYREPGSDDMEIDDNILAGGNPKLVEADFNFNKEIVMPATETTEKKVTKRVRYLLFGTGNNSPNVRHRDGADVLAAACPLGLAMMPASLLRVGNYIASCSAKVDDSSIVCHRITAIREEFVDE